MLKILGSEVPRSTAVLCTDSLVARPRGTKVRREVVLNTVDVTVLGLVGGAPGGETPRVAETPYHRSIRYPTIPIPYSYLIDRARVFGKHLAISSALHRVC